MSGTLLENLARHARLRPDNVAVRESPRGSAYTWRQLAGSVGAMATTLSGAISPGEVVLLACPNDARFIVATLAVLAAGGRVFPVAPESTASELTSAASRAGVVAAIGASEVLACLRLRLRLPLPEFDQTSVALITRDTTRAGLLLQSSGTTGLPKIVFRSAASLDAVAEAMVESIGFNPSDRVLMCLPLCHSYGIEHGLLAPVMSGAWVHLCDGFDLNAVLSDLRDGGVTIFPGVPFMFEALSRLDGAATFPSLRRAYSAGGPLPRQVYDAFLERCRVRVSQLYGATEIGSVTYGDPTTEGFDPAAVGRPMRGVSVRILDPVATGTTQPLPPGAEGHVAVSARSMLTGYVGDESAATEDGFFLTGDLGRLDLHGNLTITGRTKLLIDIGGRKVNPLEVEAVLAQHPRVQRCVVLPVQVSETVSRLKAVVVARAGQEQSLTPDELRRFARDRLVPYKVPRIIEIRRSLPTSKTGKVLRHLVAA